MFSNIGKLKLLTHMDELRIYASEIKSHIIGIMKQSSITLSLMVSLKLTNIK